MSSASRIRLTVVIGILLIAVASAATVAAGSGRFVDDNGSRYESAIETVAAAGIMRPCNPPRNDKFCPGAKVTRGEMAGFIARTFHLTATSGVRYKDVPRTGARATAIDKVVTAGIATPCTKHRFCPDAMVSRGRMALYLGRALKLSATGAMPFKDVHASTPFAKAINRLAKAGLAIGCGGHQFCPGRAVTRAELAGHIARVLALTRVTPAQPDPGNPDGAALIPPGAGPADSSSPDRVVGNGTPDELHLAGGRERRRSGRRDHVQLRAHPVTIKMAATAKVFNDTEPDVVIDGGGLVTLDGAGRPAHPVHEHLRPGPGVDHRPLPGPADTPR